MDARLEALASALAAAWRDGTTIPLPPSGQGVASRAEAYQVQDRMAALIAKPVAGWKVGATVRAVQVFEGHDGPLPGRVFADRLFSASGDAPVEVPAAAMHGMKAECELAFRVTADFPAGKPVDPAALRAAAVFHPAVEIAATRYAPGTGNRASTTFDGIADNGTGGAAVIGPAVTDWGRIPFETLEIDAQLDGSPSIQSYGGAYRRDPFVILGETIADLHGRGIDVAAGCVFLTGSSTLPTPVRRGQTLVVRMGNFAPFSLKLV